jgi:hypothetical protein
MRWWSHWSTRSLQLTIYEGKVRSSSIPPYCLGKNARYYVQLHRRHHSQTGGSAEYIRVLLPLRRKPQYIGCSSRSLGTVPMNYPHSHRQT